MYLQYAQQCFILQLLATYTDR